MDFVAPLHRRRFQIDVHWSYYAQLTYMVRVPLFSREVKARPWDRLPSDAWLPIDRNLIAPGVIIIVGFSASLIAAWDFDFPTHGEKIAWRVCSAYHAFYSISVGVYYMYVLLKPKKERDKDEVKEIAGIPPPVPPKSPKHQAKNLGIRAGLDDVLQRKPTFYDVEAVEAGSATSPGQTWSRSRLSDLVRAGIEWLKTWRNISPDGDPDMEIGLRATFVPLIGTFLLIFCRLFFYIEDFISIRQQPAGVYRAMNKFVPFMN